MTSSNSVLNKGCISVDNATKDFWIDGLVGSNPSSRPRALQRWGYNHLTSSLSSGASVNKTPSLSFNLHFFFSGAVVIATSADAGGDTSKGGCCNGGDNPLSLPPLSSPSSSIAYCHKYKSAVLQNDWVVMRSKFNCGGVVINWPSHCVCSSILFGDCCNFFPILTT